MNKQQKYDRKNKILLLLLLFGIFFTIFIRLPFIFVPFTIADEAELMTFGEQLLSGSVYGLDVVNTRGPGGFFIAGAINYVFGYGNTTAYHIIGIVFQLANVLLVYLLAYVIFNFQLGCISAFIFSIFSYGYILHDTLGFNVEIMALPFILGGVILFYLAFNQVLKQKNKAFLWTGIFFSGVLTAIVFSIKQVLAISMVAYLIVTIIYWYKGELERENAFLVILYLITGFILGFMAIFGKSILVGGWGNILYWLAIYSLKHYISWGQKIPLFLQRMILMYISQPFLWALTLLWLVQYVLSLGNKEEKVDFKYHYLFLMLILQYCGAIIAGQVVGHYLIPAMAFMSIVVAIVVERLIVNIKETRREIVIFILMLFLVGIFPPVVKYSLFPEGVEAKEYNVEEYFVEKVYNQNDPISRTVKFIKENSSQNDKIYVLGALYEIYPLTKRLPATIGFGLRWFQEREKDEKLKEIYGRIIETLKSNPPKMIVLPCEVYHGIDLRQWQDIKEILEENYTIAERFAWPGRLKFLRGKQKMTENINEWIEVYRLKEVRSNN